MAIRIRHITIFILHFRSGRVVSGGGGGCEWEWRGGEECGVCGGEGVMGMDCERSGHRYSQVCYGMSANRKF